MFCIVCGYSMNPSLYSLQYRAWERPFIEKRRLLRQHFGHLLDYLSVPACKYEPKFNKYVKIWYEVAGAGHRVITPRGAKPCCHL